MNLYISIPISGRPLHEAKAHAEALKARFTAHGHQCISPFDVCPESDLTYAEYMGRDIAALLDPAINGIVVGRNFQDSKGCNLELRAAEIYGKHIIYETCFHFLDFDTLNYLPITNQPQ